MRRALPSVLTTIVVAVMPGAAAAAELPTADRLDDRRYTAIGDRAYVVGFASGRFHAQGWHIKGEMGGYWAQPVKLLDGLWLGVDGEWIGPATRFTSGHGYVRMRLPDTAGLELRRTEFAPDGRRGVLVGLEMNNPGDARTVTLMADAHSELMAPYPWGWTTPNAGEFNLEDTAAISDGALVFSDQGKPHANAETHDWSAAVGAALPLGSGATGSGYFGPQQSQPDCPPVSEPWTTPCKDSPFGKGAGGRLTWHVELGAGESKTVWIGVAGSESGSAGALAELRALLGDPAGQLEAKRAERARIAGYTQISLPGDPLLAESIDWSKQNLADSVQVAEDLELRDTDEGRQYPLPSGVLDRVRFLGAGWPDYPWLFGTDGEFTAFASVAAGQFEPIMDHLRALRDASVVANDNSGKVVHEVVHDGSIYFGMNHHAGNTDETAKFPSAVALLWRWTGSRPWLDEMYPFARRNLSYIFDHLDEDRDGWPEGLGNVERAGMGDEKLDNTVSTIRALWDLADMAEFRGDDRTRAWAQTRAQNLERRFEGEWWMPEVPQHADSLENPDNTKRQTRHWIGVTPMEIELTRPGGTVDPGLATFDNGTQALELRETRCYSTTRGLFHTGEPGCDSAPPSPAEKAIFTLNSAIMAVGEGNYGRLGADQQRRFTAANAALQLPDPAEQPGAMPELAQHADGTVDVDRPHTERAMVLQAWGAYGTLWPVVHQQLGVRPDLGRSRVTVVPQLPSTAPIAGNEIRLGDGTAAVQAGRSGDSYTTTVDTGDTRLKHLFIGHTLPRGSQVATATLDGRRVDFEQRLTRRGVEVTVRTTPGRHTLVVRGS